MSNRFLWIKLACRIENLIYIYEMFFMDDFCQEMKELAQVQTE